MKTEWKKKLPFFCSNNYLNEEATYEINEILEKENKLDINDLVYKTGNEKRFKRLVCKSLKQQDLLKDKFITMIYH